MTPVLDIILITFHVTQSAKGSATCSNLWVVGLNLVPVLLLISFVKFYICILGVKVVNFEIRFKNLLILVNTRIIVSSTALKAKSESAKTFLLIFERHSLTNMVYITTTTATTTIEAHFGNPVTGKHTYRINIDWFYTPVKYPVWQKSYVSLKYISYTLTEVRHSWIFIIVVNVTVYHGNYPTPWQDLGGTNKQPCTSSVNRMKDNSLHFEGMGGGSSTLFRICSFYTELCFVPPFGCTCTPTNWPITLKLGAIFYLTQ